MGPSSFFPKSQILYPKFFRHWIFCMYPYLDVSGWKCIPFYYSFSGIRYENFWFLFWTSNLFKITTSANSSFLSLDLNSSCLWIVLPISPFRKYKVGCFRVDNIPLYNFLGCGSYHFRWTAPFPFWNLQVSCCRSGEEPYCNFPFQKSGFLSITFDWSISKV